MESRRHCIVQTKLGGISTIFKENVWELVPYVIQRRYSGNSESEACSPILYKAKSILVYVKVGLE